ncbi:MAG: hypothetical protein ABI890_18085 [Lapillicoccus sp.]
MPDDTPEPTLTSTAEGPGGRAPAGLGPDEFYRSPGRTRLDDRGPWWAEFLEDLARYRAHHHESLVMALLLEQGVWALLQYRISSGVYRSTLPAVVKRPALLLCVAGHKLAEAVTGFSLPYRANLHPGLYLGHYGPTLINAGAQVGAGCNISQGVSIGESGQGAERGAPVIGDHVYIGTGAVVVGPITVGSGSVIAANSLVARDVAPETTVIGVPARRAGTTGSAGMGYHMLPLPVSRNGGRGGGEE